ncbi:toprim domain-containing protein [Streptomyces albulus]|nr:toprim domain-containing protein [Streptomyces noursei]
MISIPYLKPGWKGINVVSMRFRRVGDGDGPKMLSMPGDRPRLYNTAACLTSNDNMAICEGEMDTVTASMLGLDAVGVQGTQGWRTHWAEIFRGYEKVFILADNDDAGQGMKFAEQVAESLPNARICPAPKGHDINSAFMALGKESILEGIK